MGSQAAGLRRNYRIAGTNDLVLYFLYALGRVDPAGEARPQKT